jgi:hypothetical protein
MVNDVADYIPASFEQSSAAKYPEDAFADLKNSNYTIPLLFAASHDFDEICLMLKLDLHEDLEQRTWFEYVRPYCLKQIFPMIEAFTDFVNSQIPQNTPSALCLKDFNAIGYDNRFFQAFRRRR